MSIIKVNDLTKSFADLNDITIYNLLTNKKLNETVILQNLTFRLKKGEFLGILGRNGAGKSTLLKTIGGIYSPDKGSIVVQGKMVSIFELGSFYNMELTGQDYVKGYLEFYGIKKNEIEKKLIDIRLFTELGKFFFEPIKTYSSGMQAKLLFATVTSLKADVILIDEFLVVGDEYFQGKAWKRLRNFLDTGSSGVMVSHDWESLLKLTQRSMILENNKGASFIGETYETVQKYLNIPYEISNEVSFVDTEKLLSTVVTAKTNEVFQYSFQVKAHHSFSLNQFAAGMTIEKYEAGIGWSLLYLCKDNIDIVKGKSIYTITISIYDFSLSSGDYLIALFLNEPTKEGQVNSNKGYEQLSWLNGKPIKLEVWDVTNNENKALFTKEAKWKIIK